MFYKKDYSRIFDLLQENHSIK